MRRATLLEMSTICHSIPARPSLLSRAVRLGDAPARAAAEPGAAKSEEKAPLPRRRDRSPPRAAILLPRAAPSLIDVIPARFSAQFEAARRPRRSEKSPQPLRCIIHAPRGPPVLGMPSGSRVARLVGRKYFRFARGCPGRRKFGYSQRAVYKRRGGLCRFFRAASPGSRNERRPKIITREKSAAREIPPRPSIPLGVFNARSSGPAGGRAKFRIFGAAEKGVIK